MYNLVEEKIDYTVGNKEFYLWHGKIADYGVFLFSTSGFMKLFVSDWYCQIQTMRLFMFFTFFHEFPL